MFKYLILETLRGWKALLKNYAMVVAGMIFAIFISLSVLGDAFKLLSSFLTSNMLYTACLMIFIQIVLILRQKKPIIIIKPALFHSTFNSPKFRNVKMYMIVKKIVINIILAFIIGLILFGFNFSFHSMKIIFYLVAFFLVCSVIKWMKYNHFNIIITLMVFISACTLFLLSVLYDLIIIRFFFILLCLSSLLLINKVTVNWGKYFDDILYAEKVDSAGRHMNIAEMTQITNDNMAKGNNIFKIYSMPINKKNSLMCKIIIETWRSGKKLFIFLAIMLISAIVLAKLPIISENSLLGMYHISTMVSSLLISGFFVNIIKLYQNHFQSFVDKHRKGFFVPFSHNKIMFSYLLICVLNVTVISLLLCIILSSGLIKGIIVVISFNIATFLLFILMKNKRLKKIESFVTIMINIILAFGATGLF